MHCPTHGAPQALIPCTSCAAALHATGAGDLTRYAQGVPNPTGQLPAVDPSVVDRPRKIVRCDRCQNLVRTRIDPGEDFWCPGCQQTYVLKRDQVERYEDPEPGAIAAGDASGGVPMAAHGNASGGVPAGTVLLAPGTSTGFGPAVGAPMTGGIPVPPGGTAVVPAVGWGPPGATPPPGPAVGWGPPGATPPPGPAVGWGPPGGTPPPGMAVGPAAYGVPMGAVVPPGGTVFGPAVGAPGMPMGAMAVPPGGTVVGPAVGALPTSFLPAAGTGSPTGYGHAVGAPGAAPPGTAFLPPAPEPQTFHFQQTMEAQVPAAFAPPPSAPAAAPAFPPPERAPIARAPVAAEPMARRPSERVRRPRRTSERIALVSASDRDAMTFAILGCFLLVPASFVALSKARRYQNECFRAGEEPSAKGNLAYWISFVACCFYGIGITGALLYGLGRVTVDPGPPAPVTTQPVAEPRIPPGHERHTCIRCKGTGQIKDVENETEYECSECRGLGWVLLRTE